MKPAYLTAALLLFSLAELRAQTSAAGQANVPAPTAYAIVSQEANSQVWQRETYEKAPNGTIVPHIHKYTELATGLNYKDANGQWQESKEEIDILPDGTAAATQGQHKAYFPSDIYNGTIKLVTPDGLQMKSQPIGLSYDDGTKTVLLGVLQSSVGQLHGHNQMVYPNAFSGVNADLTYTYRRSGFEQDVVIHGQLPAPESLGLNPQTTKLQMLTEFFDPPIPKQIQRRMNPQDGLADTSLVFGHTRMEQGKAFMIGDSGQAGQKPFPVYKTWTQIGGRNILIEELPYQRVAASLQKLPATTSVHLINSNWSKVSKVHLLPPLHLYARGTKNIQLAKVSQVSQKGVVLDYDEIDSDQEDITFQADMTYLISGSVNVNGAAVIEGGTVIKYGDDTNNPSIIQFWGSLVCDTAPYRPAVFTSQNDNTVGENVSDGGPLAYFQAMAGNSTAGVPFQDLRVCYAQTGVHSANGDMLLTDCQFVDCEYPIDEEWGNCWITNVLMYNVGSAFYGTTYNATAYQMTIDGCTNGQLSTDWDSPGLSTVSLVNSILVNVGMDGDATISTNYTVRLTTASTNVFVTVGAGSHYLLTNSPYHNVGTTNISAGLAADLAAKTTYPPMVYSNVTLSISETNFGPYVPRDTNAAPDLGYHYDPIDYFFGGVAASTNLTFTAGTAMGWFELPDNGGAGYGISLPSYVSVNFNGTATSPCVDARYDTVQEGGNGLWADKGYLGGIIAAGSVQTTAGASYVNAQFTHFHLLVYDPNDVRDDYAAMILAATDCEFWSGSDGGYVVSMLLTNDLFFRCGVANYCDSSWLPGPVWNVDNCTFYGSYFGPYHQNGATWPMMIQNNSFDGVDVSGMNDNSGGNTNITYCDYNAYTNLADPFPVGGSHDVTGQTLSDFGWQSSWYGNFYLPPDSPLIAAGNTPANLVGLYYFTTQTNQTIESTAIVDIGYHYVATDQYGNPLETYGDGIPDYLDDPNDTGLPGWWVFQNYGNLVETATNVDDEGNTLLYDYQNGISPARRLGYWQFNDPPVWSDAQGLLHNTAYDVLSVPSWSGDAVKLNAAQQSVLAYPGIRTNGISVLSTNETGSIRFWFKPDWNSAINAGQGPNDTIRLFEVGEETTNASFGWFALTVDPLGACLTFGTEANGIHTDNTVCPISFSTNNWYQIVLTYTSTNSLLYVDGVSLGTNGLGVTNLPSLVVLQQGFHLGCSWDGIHQANGTFDELETFNYALSASEVMSNYDATTNLDVENTGLSDLVKNAYGLNPSAVDSDCDGLPDAWKISHGLNPTDPGVATPANIAWYVAQDSLGVSTVVTTDETNLINVFFSNQEIPSNNPPVSGAVVAGSTNDVWNIGSMQSDYTNNGTPLFDAASNSTGVTLFAYIGPCYSTMNIPPSSQDFDPNGGSVTDIYGNTYLTNLTYASYVTNSTIVFSITLFQNPFFGWWGSWWGDWWDAYDDGYWLYWYGDYFLNDYCDFNVNDPVYMNDYGNYMGIILNYDYNSFPNPFGNGGNQIFRWLTITGVQNTISTVIKTQAAQIYSQSTTYEENLQNYLDNNPNLIQLTNIPPVMPMSSFLLPFAGMGDYGFSLATVGGALWNYSGNTNVNSLTASDTNVTSGEFLKELYPTAQRTLLATGLSPGNYDVYVYYAGSTNTAPAVINGVTSSPSVSAAGAKYWYANVNTLAIPAPASVQEVLTSSIPPWALSNATNNCVQITVDSPDVDNVVLDVKVTGLQIVSRASTSVTISLQAAPGIDSAYLMWQTSTGTTNVDVYRVTGSTNNTWSLVATNPALSAGNYYQDAGLTAGTTYYYKIVSMQSGGTLGTTSGVVSVTPFACAPPLPPRIDYVNPLQLPAVNGTYAITCAMLSTNSDAFDPQGYPLVFKVASVGSGSLMIDGSPFSPNNNTISNNDTAIWTPPAVMAAPGTPAFLVYVYDGYNRSSNAVNVTIQQRPQTYLFGWGANWNGTVGNGVTGSGEDGGDVLAAQAAQGIWPEDPRWQCTGQFWYLPSTNFVLVPQMVLDINHVSAVYADQGYLTSAVTQDGRLWMWGYAETSLFGLDAVYDGTNLWPWGQQPASLQNSAVYEPMMEIPSPIPFQSTLTNVQSVSGYIISEDYGTYRIILKNDGTLWSLGGDGDDVLGRDPVADGDVFSEYGYPVGMLLEQIEIPGNGSTGLVPGRQVVEIQTGSMAALARCEDGSVWSWSTVQGDQGAYPEFRLGGNVDDGNPFWLPERVTGLDIPGAAPIIQMSARWNHYAFLRADGSISEMGYIPSLDPEGNIISGDSGDPNAYTNVPVPVTGLPQNVSQISVGWTFGAALTTDGNVWIWGNELDSTNMAPRQITSLHNITKIATGEDCILALAQDGTVWAWGLNDELSMFFGSVPAGNYDDYGDFYDTAVRVPGIENVSDIFCSENNAFAVGTVVQGKPVGLTAAGGNQSMELAWSNYPAASSYVIYRSLNANGGYVAIGTSTTGSYLDQSPGLQNGQTYYYEVAAVVNGVQTQPSWNIAGIPEPAPTPVQDLTAIDDCRDVVLTWSAPTNVALSNPQEYWVEGGGTPTGPFSIMAYCPSGTYSYEDDTIVPGQTNYYQVIPVNSAGAATSSIVTGMINTANCALCPTISTNWLRWDWFAYQAPSDDYGDGTATLYWTGPQDGDWLYITNDVLAGSSIVYQLMGSDPVAINIWNQIPLGDQTTLQSGTPDQVVTTLVGDLNNILLGPSLYNLFFTNNEPVSLPAQQLENQGPTGTNMVKLNRMLLDDYFSSSVITGPSWGLNVQFAVEYYYVDPIWGNVGPYLLITNLAQATQSPGSKQYDSANDQATCYSCSWQIPPGVKCWANVSVVIGGQKGASSIEAGPLVTTQFPTQWPVTPTTVPGYRQVFLYWPDDITIYSYQVNCTALPPGTNSQDFEYLDIAPNFTGNDREWVDLGDDLFDPRYWHTGLTATNFTPVDFKYVADLVTNLTNPANLVSAALWSQFSSTATNALWNYQPGQETTTRILLASELTRIIQSNDLVFTPLQVGLSNSDLSAATLNLLSSNLTTLSAYDLARLNRLLIEDAYVHDVARYETPDPVGFVSGDFLNVNDLITTRFAQGGQTFPPTDSVALKLWNLMLPAVTNEIITNCLDGYTNDLALQRNLALEFSRIIQTNVVLFTTNDIADSGGPISSRTWSLISAGTNLTTNQVFLLNRLMIQDAWYPSSLSPCDIEPLSDLRYYWVNASFCDGDYYNSYWTAARPDDNAAAPPALAFSAQAFPYNGMVLVQWNVPGTTNYVPGNDTDWQFSLARNGADGSPFTTLTESGFGLAFLDSDVTNGQPYQYQVTAFDTNFNECVAVTAAVTPTNSDTLTLLPPQPGNTFVNLTWTPIRANQFNLVRATSPGGPFAPIVSLNTQDAYDNAQNTYQDTGLQNGVTYYYQVQAITPTGFEIDSQVQSATPLATLTPPPPPGFQGQFIPDAAAGQMQLSWDAINGAQRYQLFLTGQFTMTPLPGYDGTSTIFNYELPTNTPLDTGFTFAVRAVDAQGQAGGLAEVTVTNIPPSSTPPPVVVQPVVLQVADWMPDTAGDPLQVVGPTNLALTANVNMPDVQQVTFTAVASDGSSQVVGTANGAPYQVTWYQVPAGSYAITATAFAQDASGGIAGLGGSGASYSSETANINVNVEPQLSAYQTSATDLQLPAPALPIVLTRSYTSRSMVTNNLLGVGWTPGWNVSSIQLSGNLGTGWAGLVQSGLGTLYYYIAETTSQYATVILPGGQSIPFGPSLRYDPQGGPNEYASEGRVGINFQSYAPNTGSLTSDDNNGLILSCDDFYDWNNVPMSVNYSPTEFTYTGPDGTRYLFAQPSGTSGLTWLLTKTSDLSGDSLTYSYDGNNNLLSISNSCGRAVNFSYVSTTAGTNIEVFDTIGGTYPALIYVVVSNQLVQVQQLTDRNAGTYLTNTYVYGDSISDTQDYERLTQVYDPRNILMLQNTYTDGDGDVLTQISPGKTNTFGVDASFDVTITTTTSTATNTVEATSDQSGAIAGTTLPVSGTSPSGTLTTQNTYDSSGLLVAQTDANGNTKTYSYDDLNRLVGQSDANGNSTSTQLDSHGQPVSSTDANGDQTRYQYDSAENPVSVTDPSGTVTTYTYSAPVTDTSGNVVLGELQTSESQNAPYVPYAIVTTNIYDTNLSDPTKGDLLQTTEEWLDSGGNVVGTPVTTSYTYDANGNRLTETKTRTVNGGIQTITTAYTYDAMNRVVMTIVSATGSQILAPQTNTVTYNALGKQATSTDAAGRTTTNIYDFNGNAIETDYPDGTVSRTFYDALGHQIYAQDRAVPDGSGNTIAPATYNVYDASGRVIQTGRSDGVELTKTTAINGTDYSGLAGVTQYKLVVDSTGTVLTTNLTFYDAMGNVQYSVDARGAVTQYQYDPDYQRTNTLVYTAYNSYMLNGLGTPNPTGPYQSTSYAYDANGNQVGVTDAAGHTTTSVYDSANNVIEVDEPGVNGTVSQFTYYDGLGRKVQSTDEAGVSTGYTYDFRGLLTSVTLAFGTTQAVTTVYQYDEAGNEISQTDANGHTTSFQYDALGRRIGRILPGGQSEGFAYNLAGDQIYQTNFNGVIITNQYDVDDRLTNCTATGYHTAYAFNLLGWRTNMTDASGMTAFYYNDLGQLTNKTVNWAGGPTASLKYGYDLTGSVTNIQSSTANGVNLVYQYDILGRITNVLANGSSVANYGFDVVGNLQSLKYGNGVTNLYQYDAMNRLTNQVWKLNANPLASFAYTLGPAGNRTALGETVNGTSRNYGWAYDYQYRLTNETIQNIGTVNYAYDAVGNRLGRVSTMAALTNQSFIFNPNDWQTNTDNYDNNGSTIGSSGNTYQYDVMNHLTNVNSGSILVTYGGDGDRMSKKVGGTTTYYLVDDANPSGYAQVLEEYQGSSLGKVYDYGLDLICQRVPNTSTNYFIYDGHGSTRILTDAGGNAVNVFAYDAYGTLIVSNSTPQTLYLYSGQQFDPDLGLYYNRARYLDTETGRFWTLDTAGGDYEDPLSLHKYLFVEDSPLNFSDLSGLFAMIPSNFSDGEKIHNIIAAQFKIARPNAIPYNSSIRTILNKIVPYQGIGRLRPDLVDQTKHEIYDVKSATEIPEGIAKVTFYTGILNTVDLGDSTGGWHPGTTFTVAPNTFPIDSTGLKVAVVGEPVGGVIPYVIFQLKNRNEFALIPEPSQIPELEINQTQNATQNYNNDFNIEAKVGVGIAVTATYYFAKAVVAYMEADEGEMAVEAAF